MIYSMVPFPVTLGDRQPRFQGYGVIIDALGILCAQLTHDLFAIAKFLSKESEILVEKCHFFISPSI